MVKWLILIGLFAYSTLVKGIRLKDQALRKLGTTTSSTIQIDSSDITYSDWNETISAKARFNQSTTSTQGAAAKNNALNGR